MKYWMRWMLGLGLGLALAGGVLAYGLWKSLRPIDGEWNEAVDIGPFSVQFNMPSALTLATHPIALRLLEDHTFSTRFGPVRWEAGGAKGQWRAVCEPCAFRFAALANEPLQIARAEFTVEPNVEMKLQGRFLLGDGAIPLQGQWRSHIGRQGAEVQFLIDRQPITSAFWLFRNDLPELRSAQIDGRVSLDARLTMPARTLAIKPRVEGFRVSGLGTETLLNVQPSCPAGTSDEGFGEWLPRAVIAAEDQRFNEHAGYDLTDMLSAWSSNGQRAEAGDMQGGSTVSQQLAKLVYTGDARNVSRKLRELLYAVELDRTLGKARVMNLYLSIVPWGHGVCGAHEAARLFLNKSAGDLSPMEAVWLASLLRNPDRDLARMSRNGVIDRERVAWVAAQLRPFPRRTRDAWLADAARWNPPTVAFTSALSVAASEAARGR
jgi:hypothetical protein